MKILKKEDIDFMYKPCYEPNGNPKRCVSISVLREILDDIALQDSKTFCEFVQVLGLPANIYGDKDTDVVWNNGQVYALLKDLRDNLVFNRINAFKEVESCPK